MTTQHSQYVQTQQVGGKVLEALVIQVRQEQLAHRPHHEIEHDADDQVHQHDAGPRGVDGLAGTHEQASADGAANGDQLDVPVTQGSVQVLIVIVLIAMVAIRHDGVGARPVCPRPGAHYMSPQPPQGESEK